MAKYEDLSAKPAMGQSHYLDEDVSLRDLFVTLWRGKWIIMATTILFALAGVFFALSKPDIYQASVLLAPTQEEHGAAGLSGELGGPG